MAAGPLRVCGKSAKPEQAGEESGFLHRLDRPVGHVSQRGVAVRAGLIRNTPQESLLLAVAGTAAIALSLYQVRG